MCDILKVHGSSIRDNDETEQGLVGIPQGEVCVPDIVVEIEIQILRVWIRIVPQQMSAEGGNKTAIQTFYSHGGVSYALINTTDERTVKNLLRGNPLSQFLDFPVFFQTAEFKPARLWDSGSLFTESLNGDVSTLLRDEAIR